MSVKFSRLLKQVAREYLAARAAQDLDRANPVLTLARIGAHDELMFHMDMEGVPYTSREDAAAIAQVIVEGKEK